MPCDDVAAKLDLAEPKWHQCCDDIMIFRERPQLAAPQTLTDPPDSTILDLVLSGQDLTIHGAGGTGKSTLIKEQIYPKLVEQGRRVYNVAFTNCNAVDLPEGITLHAFCKLVFTNQLETPCTVIWDEVFRCNMYMLARLAQFRLLPDVQWILCGDMAQPQLPGHWRGTTCRNGLRRSLYLPDIWIERTVIHRCEDPVFAGYQQRLREAYFAHDMETGPWVQPFIDEIASLARARGPFDTTISLSHAQRLANNEVAARREGILVECTWEPGKPPEAPYRLAVGVRVLGRRTRPLTNGMVYTVVECGEEGAVLEETILRFGATEHKRVSVSMCVLRQDTALAAAMTVAGCQGKTLGRTRVQGMASPHMTAENLIVCTNRTRRLADLRCDP